MLASHQGFTTDILTDSVFACIFSDDPGAAPANQTSLRTPRTCKAGSLHVLLTYPSSSPNKKARLVGNLKVKSKVIVFLIIDKFDAA